MGSLFTTFGDLFIPYPFLALIPATAFAIAAKITRLKFLFLVAAGWAAYSGYEFLMKSRVLCSGDCNIRIDLLAIYPALALLTAAGLVFFTYGLATRKTRPRLKS